MWPARSPLMITPIPSVVHRWLTQAQRLSPIDPIGMDDLGNAPRLDWHGWLHSRGFRLVVHADVDQVHVFWDEDAFNATENLAAWVRWIVPADDSQKHEVWVSWAPHAQQLDRLRM